MKIRQLTIQNYKSVNELKIIDPSPFLAFIGANGVGKSNIFEAIEFMTMAREMNRSTVIELFGGREAVANKKLDKEVPIRFDLELYSSGNTTTHIPYTIHPRIESEPDYTIAYPPNVVAEERVAYGFKEPVGNYTASNRLNFSRIFIGQQDKVKLNIDSSHQLKLDGSNLEKVLKRLLKNESVREEMFDWLSLFVPGFEKLEIYADSISGRDTLLIKMKSYNEPFGRNLISDGTYNILCLLTAVYQSERSQFLCIEEPENGLNPYVIKQLVQFFKAQCEEKGHYIWVNTHSQTLVSQLKATEIILVDKKEGVTEIKQIKEADLHGLPLDEAWLTNALGGGLPW